MIPRRPRARPQHAPRVGRQRLERGHDVLGLVNHKRLPTVDVHEQRAGKRCARHVGLAQARELCG